jgi:RNA polymerase sigma-70 factor (ECF subfamily)
MLIKKVTFVHIKLVLSEFQLKPVIILSKEHSQGVCEESTFSEVYMEHSKTIYRFIYYKCGDEAKANDVASESFLKLWENCAKVTKEKARSFLYTVSNNLFLNDIKSKKVALKYARPTEEISIESPEYVLEEKEFKDKLERALAKLTEAERTAFLLNRIEGKKYKEIAEFLEISVKAVEKRIHKALVKLRVEIDGI